ncbi:MAG: glutamate--tRNA ligase [Beggiatoa sp. IS2]|nr:MAG: glutamate--tRNA ligase [Beggiatoa sp. IS2]
MNSHTVKTRFAPSPTGLMHLGNARTALFNALYAYHHHGTFLLRIEDTDIERSTADYTQQLLTDLHWLGLDWQEGPEIGGKNAPYYQSDRNAIYAQYFTQLEQQGNVYPCFCSPQELAVSRKLQRSAGQAPRYAGTCAHLTPTDIDRKQQRGLQPTLRFRVPRGQSVLFADSVRDNQQFNTDDMGDFIIRRADGTPAFFFCNAVDDALMGVTQVLRGEDHLTNTPRQILILQALNLPIPQYGHISMIVGNDGTPLSKRHGSQSLQELKIAGFLPEGIVNYLARLGHTYTEDGYLALPALAAGFLLERLGRAPARFDADQLHHWQRLAITYLETSRLWTWLGASVHALVPENDRLEFMAAVRANITFPEDALDWAKILFGDNLIIQADAQEAITKAGAPFFQHALQALVDTQANYVAWVQKLKQLTGAKGKSLFMPLRAALTGTTHGPEMANLLPLLGLEKAQARLQSCCL